MLLCYVGNIAYVILECDPKFFKTKKFFRMTSLKDPAVLSGTLGGGPHGLGDPDDTSLRRVEREVLIPKVMREKAKAEKCFEEVADFSKCCKDNSILMVVTCRKQNSALKECLGKWYENEEFKNECKKIYLEERSEYRRTGIPKKNRNTSNRI